MIYSNKYKKSLNKKIIFCFWIFVSINNLFSQFDPSVVKQNTELSKIFNITPVSVFVYNPFPPRSISLIQPINIPLIPRGLFNFPINSKKEVIEVSWDWSSITIYELIENRRFQIPFTSNIEWYLENLQKQKWHAKFFEIMHKKSKDDSRRSRGKMLEVVGLDIGRLGRASLRVSGNVNINGKMVFQDQELVRSTLNQTQNTHLEFDQKQNLNIQGKIGDKITVSMDQDSERQFDWENNIRISYEGYEDDIIQKVEAGNISLSLPSTKYVTFSGKNQGLFGVKAISKLGPIDITTIASIEKSKKAQSEWEGGGQSSKQQIRDVDWIKNRYFFIHPWFRDGIDTFFVNNAFSIPSFYPLKNGLHQIGDVVIKNFELYKSININDPNAMTGMAFVNPADTSSYSDENEEGSFIRLEQGNNYYVSSDLGFIRVREQVSQDILGCTFSIADRQTGEIIMEVGSGPDSIGTNLALMMLKPRNSYPSHSTWPLMFKNVYYLGTSQINPDGFEVKILNKNATPVSERDKASSLPYITLFGLDSLDENGNRNYDEIIDKEMANVMNMIDGELMFPSFYPFAKVDSLEGGQKSERLQNQLGSGVLYTSSSSSEINGDHRWMIEAAYTNQSSTINLGFMLIEGSEEVIQNGINLKRGLDYNIDYFTGTIILLGDAANDPNAKLKVNYDKHELVSFDKKTIFGTRAQMDLGKPNSFIGFTALYFNQSIINEKVEVGYEPTRNFIWDLNGRYEWEMDGLTRLLDKIPLIETDKISSLSLEGEVAQVVPNPNSISNNETGDPDGVAFIDDFEGSKRTTSPSIQRRFWKAASAPLKYSSVDSSFGAEYKQRNRGKLSWFNPYVPLRTKEIWPNQSTSLRAGNETTDVLILRYKSRAFQRNLNSDSLWVGVTTSLYTGDYDQIQSKFFEIWVKGNSGRLHIDMGKISEDYDGNGKLNTEDIPGAGLTLGNGFLEDNEDTGLDGCFDETEDGWGGCLENGTYSEFFYVNDSTLINMSSDIDINDPNGDNWDYEAGSSDYSQANGTESNGTGSRIQEGGKYPDTEDLDRSTFLDKSNDYFSSDFMLTDTTYLAGTTEKNGEPTNWKLFRIPLSSFKKVENIEWNEIRYVRLAVTGIDSIQRQLQIAKMEIVGNEWQEIGIMDEDSSFYTSTVNNLNSQSSLNTFDEGGPKFQVAVINTEDNADYIPPRGVKGEYDQLNEIRSKEQSLVLKFDDLPAKHTGLAQKTLYTLNDNQKRSFMTYDFMKMYVYGKSPSITFSETDVQLSLKFGLGDDYYEITQPVFDGWDEDENRNSFKVDLNWLTALKEVDVSRIKKNRETDILLDSANIRKYIYTDELGEPTGEKIKIVGKPALNRLQYFSLSVKNIGENPISGELWIDELRLSGVKKEKGVAMRMQSSLKLSDLGLATVIYSRQDADYHRLQERLSKSNNTSENLNINGKLSLDKFFPNSWGLSLPINGSFTQNKSKPKYYSGEDRLVSQDNIPDSIMIKSNSISLNTSIKKTGKSDNQILKYTIDNVSLNLSASQSTSSDVTYSQKWSENYKGSFMYNVPFGRTNYIKPFIWTENFPLIGKSLSDLHVYYTPSIFKTGIIVNEKLTWNQTRSGVKSPETYNFGLDRSLNLDYKLTNTLSSKYSWSGQSKLNEYRGYLWTAVKELDPGTVTQKTESFNTSYNPAIFKWLKPSFNYTANFRWSDDLTREGQNVSTQLRFGSNFTLTPSQLFELVYKPKSKGKNRAGGGRMRGSRTRTENPAGSNKENKAKKSKVFNPLNIVHSMFKKINPISVSYNENLNRSANQIIGEIPVGYKFGWLPDHGLIHSEEVGSNLGTWDHKRDGSIRSGIKLTRAITISTNFSQNFTTTISSSGLEQLSMTRDYLPIGDLFNNGLPFPGWSFRLSGLEKWPIIKWVAKSASFEHSYSGKETRSWQFEDFSPENMNFLNFGLFAEKYKEYERSSRVNRNFSPLFGMNMTLQKNISLTFRHNRNKSLDESPSGLTIQNDNSYTSTGTYTHRGGINIPVPFYGDLNLNNTISFTMNYDRNESEEQRSGDKINLEVGSFSKSWKTGIRMSYQFSTKVSGGVRYEYRESDTRTTGKKIDRDFGFDINLAISG